MLPLRALNLISEYSKPITKPNWRQSKPIVTTYQMYDEIINVGIPSSPLTFILLMHIIDTDWYYLYTKIKYNGKSDIIDIIHIDGFQEVELYYDNL